VHLRVVAAGRDWPNRPPPSRRIIDSPDSAQATDRIRVTSTEPSTVTAATTTYSTAYPPR
jgi:hypothetical protein